MAHFYSIVFYLTGSLLLYQKHTAADGQTTYRYDPVGLLLETALPNGVTTTYGYDAAYRPTNIVHNLGAQTLGSYAYTYDAAGNRMQVTEFDGTVVAWTYDDAYRLLSETRNGSTTSYTYDATGNRLSMTEGGVTTRYVYDALDQLLCTTTGPDCAAGVITSYDYDGRGNLVEESTGGLVTRYTFDARDRLVAVDDGTNALTYIYDAGGRRIREDLNGTVTHYRWDEFSPYGDIVVETDGSGAVTASYVLGNGKLIAQTRDGVTGYYLPDAQGSTRALTDNLGSVTDTYAYNAYGDLFAQSGTTPNPYLYTGQRFDAATDTYYLRAREYDPAVGRFLSRDTWTVDTWHPVELNRYVYAANDPINRQDPLGLQALVEVATPETKVTLEDLVALGIYSAALTCVYYFQTISIMELAGIDTTFVRAAAPDGCEPSKKDDDDDDCPPWTDWQPPYEISGDSTGQVHHIATNKHNSVWTPIFFELFSKGGLGLNSHWNKIRLAGHLGRHATDYHEYVFVRLSDATYGLKCNPYRHALQRELWSLKRELMTSGSLIRELLRIDHD